MHNNNNNNNNRRQQQQQTTEDNNNNNNNLPIARQTGENEAELRRNNTRQQPTNITSDHGNQPTYRLPPKPLHQPTNNITHCLFYVKLSSEGMFYGSGSWHPLLLGMGVGSWLPLRGIVPGILLLGMGVKKNHDSPHCLSLFSLFTTTRIIFRQQPTNTDRPWESTLPITLRTTTCSFGDRSTDHDLPIP